MDLRKKYWLFGIVCITALPAVLVLIAVFLYSKMPDQTRALLTAGLGDYLPFLLTLCLLAAMGLLILLNEVFHGFILPLMKLKEELRLITAARASHRIGVQGGAEMQELAQNINRAAELIEALQRGFPETRSHGKEKTIAKEKEFLATVLADLPGGVVAANARGRIFLYTQAAAELVETLQESASAGPPLGLDRSIFGVFPALVATPANPGSGVLTGFAQKTFAANGIRGRLLKSETGTRAGGYYLIFLQPEQETAGRRAGESGRKRSRSDLPNYDLSLLKQRRIAQTDLRDIRLAELTYTVFDLETTGLNPAGGDEIISIGAVRVVGGRILFEETFYQMVRPKGDIPEKATRVHGITRAMLQGQPGIDEVLPAFCRYIEDSVIVSHDAAFDWRFLQKHAQAAGLAIENPLLDTFHLSRLAQQTQRDHTLENIAGRLGTRIYDRHIAYGDAWTAAEILLKLISVLNAQGIRTLRQIQARR